MKQLTGLDASFLYSESQRTPMHVGGIYIYDPSTAPGGVVRFKDILSFIEERLHRANRFREKIVRLPFDLDHPYWLNDPEFDIEYHVRHIALPQPGDWRQLCILASRLHARALDVTKPLWEFNIVEGLDNVPGIPPGSYAMITKVHHCAIDGVSGMEMTAAINSVSPDDEAEQPEKPWLPDRVPTIPELMFRAYFNNVRQPYRYISSMGRFVPSAGRLIEGFTSGNLRLPIPANGVPRTRFNGTVSAHRVIEGRVFDLGTIREIKSRHAGATVNDVVLSIVGGGMRNYLREKNELPGDSLVAMAPVSVRSKNEKTDMGNQVTAMSVSLGTHVSDPAARLEWVHDAAENSKALTNAIGARQLADYSKFMPSMWTGLAARLYTQLSLANRTTPMFNAVVTNVPGPQVPLYSHGARMVHQYGTGPIYDGAGIIHPVLSYNGEITISFTSCRNILPDPEHYADCLEESFEELRAAMVKSRPSLPKTEQLPKPEDAVAAAALAETVVAKAPAAEKAPPARPTEAAVPPEKEAATPVRARPAEAVRDQTEPEKPRAEASGHAAKRKAPAKAPGSGSNFKTPSLRPVTTKVTEG